MLGLLDLVYKSQDLFPVQSGIINLHFRARRANYNHIFLCPLINKQQYQSKSLIDFIRHCDEASNSTLKTKE